MFVHEAKLTKTVSVVLYSNKSIYKTAIFSGNFQRFLANDFLVAPCVKLPFLIN